VVLSIMQRTASFWVVVIVPFGRRPGRREKGPGKTPETKMLRAWLTARVLEIC
jgi:hypothetical protein